MRSLSTNQNTYLSDSKTIPSSEQTAFKGLCGGLSWAVINTRPDHAFDVSWLASRGLNATGADVAFGNKIMRAMKQKPMKLRFIKVGSNIADWCMVTFHDAGWATRPSLHSQAGGAISFLLNPQFEMEVNQFEHLFLTGYAPRLNV